MSHTWCSKLPLLAVGSLAVGLLAIPVVIGGNSGPSAAGCGDLAVILDTIRTIESGGDYTAPKNPGGASGAYQYIDSTWNDYEGYTSAYLAPPEIQDARAAIDVQAILAKYGDVAYVPIVWYWPRAADDPSQLDIVPMPGAGNRSPCASTRRRGSTCTSRSSPQAQRSTASERLRPRTATPCRSTGRSSMPTPTCSTNPTTTTPPSTSWSPTAHPSTPSAAAPSPESSTGRTTAGSIGRCDETCGVGISINGDDGVRYIYCHGSRLNDRRRRHRHRRPTHHVVRRHRPLRRPPPPLRDQSQRRAQVPPAAALYDRQNRQINPSQFPAAQQVLVLSTSILPGSRSNADLLGESL